MHAHPGHIELLFKGAKLLEEGLEVGVALEKPHVVLLSGGHGWELLQTVCKMRTQQFGKSDFTQI